MHLFYTPDIQSDIYTLNEEESRHAVKVLRLSIGDHIQLIDGRGGWYEAEIISDHHKACEVKVIEKREEVGKRNFYLHLAVAPTKNIDRFEWFLEKATEIGIDEITPIICERSERREVKNERLEKVITSAVKQSLKAFHPRLNPAVSFKEFISKQHDGFIAHCIPGEKKSIKEVYKPATNVLLLIGPEGDFTQKEVEVAKKQGLIEVTLGESRLRTETAALVACDRLNFLNSGG